MWDEMGGGYVTKAPTVQPAVTDGIEPVRA